MVQGEARGRFALPAVGVGVLAVSSAAILIRVSGAPALGIAFWRCALGVVFLLPVAVVRRERLPVGHPLVVLVVSGAAVGRSRRNPPERESRLLAAKSSH